MYFIRGSPAGNSVRRHGERATSTSMVSQTNGSFTESSIYTPSVYSEGHVAGHQHRSTASRFTSTSASPRPEHFDDANLYAGADGADTRENFRVAVRVRPPLPRELHGYRPFVDVVQITAAHENTITLCDALDTEDGRAAVYSRQSYAFDRVYSAAATQEEVYERSARPAVLSVLEGYNATLMAYGQTGTGKTYTMEGFTNEEERGIIPRAVEDVFAYIHEKRSASADTKFLVRASYMQIYNEVISDLLEAPNPSLGTRSSLGVRHTPQRGVYVDGLSEWVVRTPEDVYGLIAKGTAQRATSATRLSELSSRSHAIFTIVVEAMEGDEASPLAYRFGKLHIVDLAGSEKIRLAGVTGQRLEETKSINKSLHELGNVIAALAAKSTAHGRRGGLPRHIPFRNSALTSALRDSLGGNCKTTLIACISPALESYAESLSTLMFANRAKNIQTHAVVNEGVNQATLLRTYEQELRRLRQQLQERTEAAASGADSVDTHVLLSEMEEDYRRAEKDRVAALAALQQSSAAHQEELRVREELEGRIRELEAIMREGGMEGNPRTSQEYAERLLELDRERQAVAEDKEQVDRYKHLLLKQRDIMLSLTTRLNDRDETILLLQEEVDAYDQHVLALEEELDQALRENSGSSVGVDGGDGGSGRRPPSFVVNPRSVGRLSEAQAAAYVQRLRVGSAVTGNPAGSGDASASPSYRYRSLLQPTRTVTAEQLSIELVMLQGCHDADSNGSSPRGGAGAMSKDGAAAVTPGFSEAELARAVQQRADSMLRSHYDEQLAQLRCTVADLTLQLRNSEDNAHVADKAVDQLILRLRSSSNGNTVAADAMEGLRGELRAEWESRRKAYAATIDAVQDAVRTDGVERARLGREVDRVRLEMQHLLESATPPVDAEQRSAVSRVWQRLQEVEEKARLQGTLSRLPNLERKSTSASAPLNPSSSPPAVSADVDPREHQRQLLDAQARERALQATVNEQQAAIQKLEREAAGLRASLVSRNNPSSPASPSSSSINNSNADAEEVARLQQQLTIHEKDRRALRTILEQRMRGKIDRICDMLSSGDAVNGREGGGKLGSEARSLQGLIHASIKAMDVDI
ncbi:putative kinesin [Leptomonas pyrrhocoris]|uniref:Putative kinesin n=1 Tax=Leptomonas pyrrhocoris TaxID=157538 RepID=A0A0M9G0K9_LEPPY|nr:putative kinesin [Leptomonas pyrrhocoris]KPA79716.1 putative kinesin [Leptomonas pyrrhocoris]|eukprot:XP_015658155.1 putative kinesin [Leptomonas pyrrhocoris]